MTHEALDPQPAAATATTGEDIPKDSSPYTPADLIELIRAIKFAHPSKSQRAVQTEITTVIASSSPSYEFLKEVKLNDVKKVWKKALKADSKQNDSTATASAALAGKEDPPILPPGSNDGILKFYTVGDGSVRTLVENYSNYHAKAAAEALSTQDNVSTEKNYTHFFLDVPADTSGARPHQALINFNDNKSSKRYKKHSVRENGRQIFKIQMAAPPPGMEDTFLPMLLYNADRSAKTFLHPPSVSEAEEDDGGYFKIQNLIVSAGKSGALGSMGGTKAYFWGFVKGVGEGKRLVSLDVEELAPSQVW